MYLKTERNKPLIFQFHRHFVDHISYYTLNEYKNEYYKNHCLATNRYLDRFFFFFFALPISPDNGSDVPGNNWSDHLEYLYSSTIMSLFILKKYPGNTFDGLDV